VLHRLDHHDRIVDDDADGEDEAEHARLLMDKPRSGNSAKVPTIETGTARSGIKSRVSSGETRTRPG